MTLFLGDCRGVMAAMEPASVDAIVTDPPAGIAFMGKEWDRNKGGRDAWITWLSDVLRECYRVAKPGAHAVVWALPRTSGWTHRSIEDAGFEVRDCVVHLFGSGFPKSHNLPGGLGTALKPAAEFWYLARKPLIGTVAANVERYGTGAINVGGCRIEASDNSTCARTPGGRSRDQYRTGTTIGPRIATDLGRWPANVILDEESSAMLDAQSGERKSGARTGSRRENSDTGYGSIQRGGACEASAGGASRFFYCAKASRSERNAGLDGMPERRVAVMNAMGDDPEGYVGPVSERFTTTKANHHPTVKPIALMRWLVRLVTPPSGTVLDPFMGSGTTGVACVHEGFDFIGIEQSEDYLEIARRRIAHAIGPLFTPLDE